MYEVIKENDTVRVVPFLPDLVVKHQYLAPELLFWELAVCSVITIFDTCQELQSLLHSKKEKSDDAMCMGYFIGWKKPDDARFYF